MKPTPHQEETINNIINDLKEARKVDITNDSIIELSGGAGVGKTFSVLYIINFMKFLGWSIAVTTPTHASLEVAKNIAKKFEKRGADEEITASTIHSFLNLKIENDYKTGKQVLRPNPKGTVKKCDLLIIDEKSMVGVELFDYVKKAVDRGDVKSVLLVGDKYQLPVVDDKMIELDSSHSYELTEVVRQAKDNPLIKLSMELRKCIELERFPNIGLILDRHPDVRMTRNPVEFLQTYGDDKTMIDFKVIGAFTNDVVNTYNNIIREAYHPNKPFLVSGDKVILQQPNLLDKGDYTEIIHANGENVELYGVIESTKKIKGVDIKYFKCADKNNKPIDIINPESEQDFYGILQGVANQAKMAHGDFRSDLWKEYFQLKEEFIEVKYPMAMTIHKLQGSSFASVYGDIRDIQNMQGRDKKTDDMLFRLLYVLVTRSSDKLILLRN